MDKNMINIDDLVRQRMDGAEEKPGSGAWLQMRDLLDEKMPITGVKGSGYNWKRILSATAGVLLLALLSFGGYEYLTGRQVQQAIGTAGSGWAASEAASEYANSMNEHTANSHETVAVERMDNDGNTTPSSDVTLPSKKTISSQAAITPQATVAVTGIASKNVIKQATTNHRNKTTITKATTLTSSNQPTTSTTKAPVETVAPNTSSSNVAATPLDLHPQTTNSPLLASGNTHTTATTSNAVPQAHSNGTVNSLLKEGAKTNHLQRQQRSEVAPAQPSQQETKTAMAVDNTNNTGNKNTTSVAAQKDSMRRITVEEKIKINTITKVVSITHDTVMTDKVAVEKTLAMQTSPSSNDAPMAAVQAAPPAASHQLTVKEADNQALAVLSASKVKKSKKGMYSNDAFQQRLENMRFRLSQIKFYPGISFGLNSYLFGPSSMMGGYQVGLRGQAVFDEKWSMMAELKYIQRFNQNMKVSDNYWRLGTVSGNQYEASFIEHYFKFSTVNSIELPIALVYHWKRLQFFAGGNIAYNFNLNPEEVTREYESKTYQGNMLEKNTHPTIFMKDFVARYSVGYLLGAGYDISPAFNVDLRVTQNFWDDAAGSGPRKISTQLYYRPSFQFSIHYRFPQKNVIPKAR